LKADAHLAEELVEVFGEKKMPPETMPQPTAAEYQKLLGWVKSVGS
jgi:hypothetical protein